MQYSADGRGRFPPLLALRLIASPFALHPGDNSGRGPRGCRFRPAHPQPARAMTLVLVPVRLDENLGRVVALLVGALLAFSVGLFATGLSLDRDRAFYPVVTMVIASYYALFAVIGASTHTLVLELLVGALFLAVAVSGFRRSLWVVVVALAAHGIFDLTHDTFIANAGVPVWWPQFCLTYDLTAAAYLAWLLTSGRIRAAA